MIPIGKLFICDVCESEFDGKPQLQDHKESIHGNKEHTRNPQLFKCLLCEHKMYQKYELLKTKMRRIKSTDS